MYFKAHLDETFFCTGHQLPVESIISTSALLSRCMGQLFITPMVKNYLSDSMIVSPQVYMWLQHTFSSYVTPSVVYLLSFSTVMSDGL